MTRKTRENRQEFEQSLTSYAERTGFPVDELNRLRAERQAERRRLLTIRGDTAAQVTNDDEAAFVYGVKSQRDTLGLLTTPLVITLNQPAAIGSQHFDEAKPFEFESHIEPFNSFARVLINDVHSGFDNGGVNFQFPWENASQSFAVINIGTLLRFTGLIQANSDNRFFSGDPVSTQLFAALSVTRGAGWGVDPDGHDLGGTSVPIMGNTLQQVAGFTAIGGGWFEDSDSRLIPFAALPIGLGTDFVVIPAGASIVINASLAFIYSIADDTFGVDEANYVTFDFSSAQFNRRIGCPFLHVEVLT